MYVCKCTFAVRAVDAGFGPKSVMIKAQKLVFTAFEVNIKKKNLKNFVFLEKARNLSLFKWQTAGQ